MAKVELTKPFANIFNGIRPLVRVEADVPVVCINVDGAETGYEITDGWYMQPLSDGTGAGDKEFMLWITDRPDIDPEIYAAHRFRIGDTTYERVGSPSSPATNPALWKILIKPVTRRTTDA